MKYMDTKLFLLQIDAEISNLQRARQAIASIADAPTTEKKPARRTHHMSVEARARISAAQKARWAKTKKS